MLKHCSFSAVKSFLWFWSTLDSKGGVVKVLVALFLLSQSNAKFKKRLRLIRVPQCSLSRRNFNSTLTQLLYYLSLLDCPGSCSSRLGIAWSESPPAPLFSSLGKLRSAASSRIASSSSSVKKNRQIEIS